MPPQSSSPPAPPDPPAKDRVLAWVKERVLNGDLAGGELISEGDVAAQLGVSRTPVREAFLILEAEGLMRLYPKRGAFIVPLTAKEVREVMEVRLVVERHAVERLARESPDIAEAVLDDCLRRGRDALERGDLKRYAEYDRLLHHLFVVAAGNTIMARLHDSLRDRQRRMGTAALNRDPSLAERFQREHEEIVDAIRRGDPETAVRLLEGHVEGARTGLEHALPTAPLS